MSDSDRSTMKGNNQSKKSMTVSLVVPVRNEGSSLRSLFDSINRQTLRPEEIIMVDGGSTDRTVALAREMAAGDPRFKVIEAGEATPGRGRNIGVAAARNQWIALTDAGVTLDPDWLERLVEAAESDTEVGVVYGNYEPVTSSFFERCAALSYTALKQQRPAGKMRGPSTASMLIRREVWESAGGFPDLRAAEDLIFIERVEEKGVKTGWAPGATAWWQLQPTLAATFKKFALYSKHNVIAGRERYWHHGIAKKYLLGLPFFVLAVAHSWWWLTVPLAGALARVGKSIWNRSEERGILWRLNPAQFAGVGVILAAIDLATFVGWARAVWQMRKVPGPAHYPGRTENTR